MVFNFFNKNRWLFIVGAVAMALPHAYAQQDIEPTEDETVMQTEESLPVNPLNPANQQKVYKRTKVKNFKDEAKYKIITKQATMPEKYDVGSPDVASMHKVDAMVLANTAYPDLPNVDIPLTLTETTPSVSSKPLLVRTESVTGKEQALLEKVKAEKLTKQVYAEKNVALITATDAQTPDEQSQYMLTPSESVIKAERSRVVAKPKVKSAEDIYIDKLEFNQANMLDVSRALADISGLNFVATEEAAKKSVTVFLQNISVKNALEAITKNAGLWYRKDKESGTYRIMSTKEYQQDLVVYREDTTRVFNLLHPNPIIVATAIRDLYGDRVILSMGAEDQTFMPMLSGNGGTVNSQTTTNISSSRRGTSSRNAQSNTNITRQNVTFSNGRNNSSRNQDNSIRDDLTPDQLEKLGDTLAERGDVYTLTSDELRGINNREQPIYVTLNREHDLMLVRTTDNSVIKDIEKLVKEMDRPTKQVLLEMKILSLDVGDSYRQSMDLDYMPSSDPVRGPFTNQDRNPLFDESPINVTNTTTTGTTTSTQSGSYTVGVRNILGLGNFALEGGTFVYQFLSDKIRARIQLLQQNNRINTLSSPILLSSNNKPARVFVGTEQVVTTGFDAIAGAASVAGVGAPAIIPITELRNIGNTLQVMPKVNADKTVTLLIQQDSSTLVRGASTIPIPVGSTIQSFNVDSVRTSNIQGTVQAKDGLTIAIGGLIDSSDSEEEQKIPVIGDFPILGDLFKRKVQQKSKRELLLLITPHIIESAHDGEDLSRDALEPITEQEW